MEGRKGGGEMQLAKQDVRGKRRKRMEDQPGRPSQHSEYGVQCTVSTEVRKYGVQTRTIRQGRAGYLGQGRAEQGRAEQNRASQGKAKQARQGRARRAKKGKKERKD